MSNHQFTLNTGRILFLRFLNQHSFYAGMIGLPTHDSNLHDLERLKKHVREQYHSVNIYFIEPTEIPIQTGSTSYSLGYVPVRFPGIVCIARFESFQTAVDHTKDYSDLIVVWLQDGFAFPIDDQVLEQIKAIDWERYARDFEI